MPVEKLRELSDDCPSPPSKKGGGDRNNGKMTTVDDKENGSPKNGILHKSGSKLGFSKKKIINNGNHHHHLGNNTPTDTSSNGRHNPVGASTTNNNSSSGQGKKGMDDPFRFLDGGVDFKAKLIGVRDVTDARGDQMCQDAIQLCKALVKSSGQHKQRILFNVSVEGLKIKELSNGRHVQNFPVNKVSFIAKDVTDNRAFGFVYGSPDEKHKFYAVKTEKTSDQVVLSIRDMFHVVYAMKKKQMEEAKQSKGDPKVDQDPNSEGKDGHQSNGGDTTVSKDENGVAVADLLDLETELENLKQGVQDMNTAWDDFNPRAGESEIVGLSTSLSSASFGSSGNGYHSQYSNASGGFYQGHPHANVASSPDFFSLSGAAPSSLNETTTSSSSSSRSSAAGDDQQQHRGFGAETSTSVPGNNIQNFFPSGPAVPPPPATNSRRRTTSSSNNNGVGVVGLGNGTANNFLVESTSTTIGGHSDQNEQAAPVFLIDQRMSNGNAVRIPSEDPFDTSHVLGIVNNGTPSSYVHHAASTPIGRSSASSLFGGNNGPMAVSMEMSQPPSAIVPYGEFSSPDSNSVFGATPVNNHATGKVFSSPNNGASLVNNSLLNEAMFGSQLAGGGLGAGRESNPVDKSSPSLWTTSNHNSVSSPHVGTGSNGISSSPLQQQSLLNPIVLKAPNATSVDQAFNVLCNLDALVTTGPAALQEQQNHNYHSSITNGNGALSSTTTSSFKEREDLFAQMRPPPKKSINELRGSPPNGNGNGNGNGKISLDGLEELYSSSPTAKSPFGTPPSVFSASAPPIPPRSAGLISAPPSSSYGNGTGTGNGTGNGTGSGTGSGNEVQNNTQNLLRHNNTGRALPRPIPNSNNNNEYKQKSGSEDPFADDPFFASN